MMSEENMMLEVRVVNGESFGQDGEAIEDNYTEYNKRSKETKAVAKEAEDKLIEILNLTFKGERSVVISEGEIYRDTIKVDSKMSFFPRIEVRFVFCERIVHPEGTGMKWDRFEHDIWANLELRDCRDSEYIGLARDFHYQLDTKEWTEETTGMEDGTFKGREDDK